MTDWLIEKLVPGGDGMARLADGRVAFAAGALPGDVVSPIRTIVKKGYVRAEVWELARPSPLRVEPPCPIASHCGGCDWMALDRASQLRHKGAILREALQRTGRFSDLPAEIPVVSAGSDLGYRTRVRFHIEADGTIGFFAKRSHDLVEVERCAVCRPEINLALERLREIPRDYVAPFSGVEIRGTLEAGRVELRFAPRAERPINAAARAGLGSLSDDYAVAFEGEAEDDGGDFALSLPGGVRVQAAPGAFTQVNLAVNAALITEVVEGAKSRNVSRFLDLFAGVGNFALPLLQANMAGTAVEHDARAVRSARNAALAAGLPASGFVTDDVGHFLSKTRPEPKPDLVLMDPPRRGAKDVLDDVVRWAPPHIAMCYCDPVTLARDLATLALAGYLLGDVRAFDMFPHTHHLEALAWMELQRADRRRA